MMCCKPWLSKICRCATLEDSIERAAHETFSEEQKVLQTGLEGRSEEEVRAVCNALVKVTQRAAKAQSVLNQAKYEVRNFLCLDAKEYSHSSLLVSLAVGKKLI